MTIFKQSVALACFAIVAFSGSQVVAAGTLKDFQESEETPLHKNFLSLAQDLESQLEVPETIAEVVNTNPEVETIAEVFNTNPEVETIAEVVNTNPEVETIAEVVNTNSQETPQYLSEINENSPSTDAIDLNVVSIQPQWRIAEEIALGDDTLGDDIIAQSWQDNPRRAADRNNRRLSNHFNYFAVGGNIGITGNASGLGKGGGGTLGKTGYSENLSLHTGGVLIGEGASVTALTYSFPMRVDTGGIVASPFIGAGIIYADLFNSDFSFGPLFMTGVDVPISYSFILTGRFNVGYIRETTEVGVMLGVGYVYTRSIWNILGIF
ncbi:MULTISPECIES: hypothetical protein [Limnospira]|jgi:hypothetical protein|uniref:Uncharacterized protein n=1 Tax=Limnospira platensis NIES-46 TaxID=1236695 RepID=A0A5M3TAQ3_LIMPL|nr:hypothetical protein [Arthrospira platensis]KDR54279.1 hypothetical protein APPUASWS_029865 [Arthrospira platensis str. Paraca]MBD2669758.1 hypothetical protein [Arthrospira platensis FACHB-439]MDF2212075.1 hypothetical protein [Arthrospira platensis NCB002]MDT9184180.1 hypothetical protein [Limnospira sp. PMC 289.06]QQW27844.1 hypothetical protein AP9108_22185 [Arthrospira sp. PCC 9108]BAI92403.1 hypothetical protein NIES39_L02430 [Arthrospira platensis NIES-39]